MSISRLLPLKFRQVGDQSGTGDDKVESRGSPVCSVPVLPVHVSRSMCGCDCSATRVLLTIAGRLTTYRHASKFLPEDGTPAFVQSAAAAWRCSVDRRPVLLMLEGDGLSRKKGKLYENSQILFVFADSRGFLHTGGVLSEVNEVS